MFSGFFLFSGMIVEFRKFLRERATGVDGRSLLLIKWMSFGEEKHTMRQRMQVKINEACERRQRF